MLSLHSKEAVKTALAMVITYWIALSASWMNPHWAALTVALISLPTAGESIKKGLQRLFGTIPACIVALLIIMVAAQDRWLFVTLACTWIFLTTYIKQIDQEHDHFWQIAGFVCLVILSGSTTSTAYFNLAIYRTLETGMGVTVYSLVCLFIWPQLKKSNEDSQAASPSSPSQSRFPPWLMLLVDRDLLVKSLFAAFCPFAGFLLWIYFDPAGHAGWFVITGAIGMIIATMPQIRASMLVIPLGVFLGLALLLYIFVLPRLENFYELGTLIFVLIFLNSYFLKGVPRILGAMAIVMELSIRNVQVYNFPAMANTYVFILLAFLFVYALSYLLGSSRPEKKVIHYVHRFFGSASHLTGKDYGRSHWLNRLCDAYHLREVQSIPQKIAPWIKSVPPKACPDNTEEKTTALIASLQSMSQELSAMAMNPYDHSSSEATNMREQAESCFQAWLEQPESSVELTTPGGSTPKGFDNLLQSMQSYANATKAINWNQWREERFS